MADVLFLAVLACFAVLSGAFLALCDRLQGGRT